MAMGDRRKGCKLCADKIDVVDYKDEKLLRRFMTDRGKVVPRRVGPSSGPASSRSWPTSTNT